MEYCKVKYCRYPDTHLTIGHKCEKCQTFGHGQFECGNNDFINSLYIYRHDILPNEKQCIQNGQYDKNFSDIYHLNISKVIFKN